MNIRDARIADETAVVELWKACDLVVPYNDPGHDFRFALNGLSSTVLVCETEQAIVGTVLVGHDGHRGWIYYVAIDPALRLKGIGRALVAAAEEWLRARAVRKLQLMIRETNADVARFYARLGFEPMPRINMQKWLKH